MRRREFIAVASVGVAVAWPLAARAQQTAMPVIGFLNSRTAADTGHLVRGFRRGLAESDYVEGQNVAIEYRWASGRYDRLPELALELVRRPVAVIVATGGDPVGLAAKAATSTIPIIFVVSGDPAKLGLAASFTRPGGNSTGLSIFTSDIGAKRLGLLRELVPQAAKIGFLSNPTFPTAETQLNDVQEGARSLGVEIEIFRASTEAEIESAFNAIPQQRLGALVVAADPFYDTRRVQLVVLMARHSLPAMYHLREYAAAGGLMSYGIDLADVYRQMGSYAGKILRGAKPADLPVVQPTRFELVINLPTARVLGLTVPQSLLAAADEVIE
jgi:putative tryptophan/tyrosine transport system substrate-binding protein